MVGRPAASDIAASSPAIAGSRCFAAAPQSSLRFACVTPSSPTTTASEALSSPRYAVAGPASPLVVTVPRIVERRALKHRATGGPEQSGEREAQRHDDKGSEQFSVCWGHAAR